MSRYVWPYQHIAYGACSIHGWYQHQLGFSGCDKCEDEKMAAEDAQHEPGPLTLGVIDVLEARLALTVSCAELEERRVKYEAMSAQQNALSCPQMALIGRDQYDAVVGEETRGMGGVERHGQILAKMWEAVGAAEPPEQVAEEDLMALVATTRPVDELRPPPEHDGRALHWVYLDPQMRLGGSDSDVNPIQNYEPQVWCWAPRKCCGWSVTDPYHGRQQFRAPVEAHNDGYRYLGPAEWHGLDQIYTLIREHDQLRREIAAVRELLSKVEDAPTDPVQSDIERTIDHLLNGRTTRDQRKGLNTAAERAERVAPDADAAVGRALR